jgi:hypothetical protein
MSTTLDTIQSETLAGAHQSHISGAKYKKCEAIHHCLKYIFIAQCSDMGASYSASDSISVM